MLSFVLLLSFVAGSPEAAPGFEPCGRSPVGMACLAGGSFQRGRDHGPANERPREAVTLSTFHLDVTEVTVEAWDACVAAGRCAEVRTLYSDYSRPRQPKVGVSWFDADAYCRALGKHLPTEAEWEKAARGTDGRLYPWGDQVATCERAVIMTDKGRSCGVKKAVGQHPDKGRTFEVGSKPADPHGLHDMSGNAEEWVADWASASYEACGDACRGLDPRGPGSGREKVVRGGSWYWPAANATSTHRRFHVPSNRPYHHFGFRCAASPAEAAALR
jgi:formylglycine-generating enzyme required for sulfatase activity